MVTPKEGKRISKIDMYLNCAENFAYRSTCLKRKYGAVIVKDDVVISTGYNGSPRGFENCCDMGKCPRMERQMHQGEGYGICRAIHAEANALLNCSREQTLGADLYLTGINPKDNSIYKAKPCPVCARIIIQAGINNVIMRQGDGADNYIILPAKKLQWVLDIRGCRKIKEIAPETKKQNHPRRKRCFNDTYLILRGLFYLFELFFILILGAKNKRILFLNRTFFSKLFSGQFCLRIS